MKVCPTLASVTGLLGGYKVASTTGNRPLGGAVLGVCGIIAFMNWKRKAGAPRATFLTGLYGMNVEGLPYATRPWAFDAIAGACLLIAVTIVGWFVLRRWFR